MEARRPQGRRRRRSIRVTDQPSPTLKENLRARATWTRGLFMLLFAVIYGVAELLLLAVAVFQFASVLLSGRPNERLAIFGEELGRFFYQVICYLTFRADDKPFPFSDWPRGAGPGEAQGPSGDGGWP